MVIGTESETSVHFCTTALGKDMNLFLAPTYGLNSRIECLREVKLNSEPRRRQPETTPMYFSRMHGISQIIIKKKKFEEK